MVLVDHSRNTIIDGMICLYLYDSIDEKSLARDLSMQRVLIVRIFVLHDQELLKPLLRLNATVLPCLYQIYLLGRSHTIVVIIIIIIT